MPLLGRAAMLLGFDIVAEAIDEHDDWHTHEHLPERLSIPGFLRGTRWTALGEGPRYLVLYEVEHLDTLASPAYLERLNDPSPWTRRMMPHYRGMTRGLCTVASSVGLGMGHFGLLIRFRPDGDAGAALERWLADDVMPGLPVRRGLGSAHLLRGALPAPMTSEQRIRGTDAGVDWALLATGYLADALAQLQRAELAAAEFERRSAAAVASTLYQSACTLSASELHSPFRNGAPS